MIQENYQKFLKKNKRDVVLKKFKATPEKFFIEILCDGKHYTMECENKPQPCGDWFPEGIKDGEEFPKDCPDYGDIIYYNDEFILITVENVAYCFSAKDYKAVEMRTRYLYDIIYVNDKIYILVDHNNPKLYEVKKFWERPSELFFIVKEGKLYWGHIIADDEQGYFRGSNIAYAIDGIGVDFVVEPVDELLEKLIAMKKEACI